MTDILIHEPTPLANSDLSQPKDDVYPKQSIRIDDYSEFSDSDENVGIAERDSDDETITSKRSPFAALKIMLFGIGAFCLLAIAIFGFFLIGKPRPTESKNQPQFNLNSTAPANENIAPAPPIPANGVNPPTPITQSDSLASAPEKAADVAKDPIVNTPAEQTPSQTLQPDVAKQDRVEVLNQEVSPSNTAFEELRAQINDLTAKSSAFSDTLQLIEAHQTKLDSITTDLDQRIERKLQHESATQPDKSLDELKTQVSQLSERISAINADILNLKKQPVGLAQQVTSLRNTLKSQTEQLQQLGQARLQARPPFQINGVMVWGNSQTAQIGSQAFNVGDVLSGWRIESISAQSVGVKQLSDGLTVTIPVDGHL